MAIKSFFDQGTGDIYNRVRSKEARRSCPEQIWRVAQRKLDQLNAAVTLDSLRIPPGNQLEALKEDRKGQHSIRINDRYRLCFSWTDDGPAYVEITDYH
jgi:proteic killer suppression protein